MARSSSSDGSEASALTPFGVQGGLAHRSAEDDELLVRLGEVGGDLGRRDHIARISDDRRALEQGSDGRDVRAFESDLGEAVLRDLHGGAGLPHLLAQSLHLGDREAGIVSDNDDVGGLEDPVQRLDGRFLFRSIHVGTLFGWRQDFPWEIRAAGCTSRPVTHRGARTAPAGRRRKPVRRTLRASQARTPVQRFEPISRPHRPDNPSSPVYAGRSIKPEARACSLGQDDRSNPWRLQSRTGRFAES